MKRGVDLIFDNIKICNPEEVKNNSRIIVENGLFGKQEKGQPRVDLKGYVCYPGLFNSHDHLMGTYYPRVGNGPYLSWKGWDEDLKNSLLYKERGNLSVEEVYQLSYYRHLLCGVTSVCDHIPLVINRKFIDNPLLRIVEQYCIAHEISSYELPWGDAHHIEIKRAKQKDIPFITHIEEGFDKEALRGVDILDEKGGLFNRTVLVHCIGCSSKDIKKIATNGCSMVWCPQSNLFMFNKTANVRSFLKEGTNVTIGTDSPMSGGINLFEELRAARDFYNKNYPKPIQPKTLFKMATINAAKAFKLDKKVGSITPGKEADYLILKDKHDDPYENLINANWHDVYAVARKGKPVYLREEAADFFGGKSVFSKNYQKALLQTGRIKVKSFFMGNAVSLKTTINKKLKRDKFFPFLPIITK